MPLICCLTEPLTGLGKILLYTLAVVIHQPQIELCRRKTLAGCLLIPFQRFFIILF